MSKTLTEIEAKAQFSQLITDVCNGEEVVISRGNTPVAYLMPITQAAVKNKRTQKDDEEWEKKISSIRELRKKMVIGPPITIEEIISARDEGRKYL